MGSARDVVIVVEDKHTYLEGRMMLKDIYALLSTIEKGIAHEAEVTCRLREGALVVRAAMTCTKDRRRYYYQHCFSVREMTEGVEDTTFIDYFIAQANHIFKVAYKEAA